MFYARNAQEVGVHYGNPYLLHKGGTAEKLTITVKEAPVILQITEEIEQFFSNELETESFLDLGTHSLVFITPITGWRFRSWEAAPGVIDFRAYG